jgi:hypothetical protein
LLDERESHQVAHSLGLQDDQLDQLSEVLLDFTNTTDLTVWLLVSAENINLSASLPELLQNYPEIEEALQRQA